MKNLKEVDGKKLHAGMLDAAEKAVAGRGDGRISENDAHEILKTLSKEEDNDGLGVKTALHIYKNHNLTEQAQSVFANSLIASAMAVNPQNALTFKEGDIITLAANNYKDTLKPSNTANGKSLHCPHISVGTYLELSDYNGDTKASQWMLFPNRRKKPTLKGETVYWHLVNLASGTFLDVEDPGDGGSRINIKKGGRAPSCDRDWITWALISDDGGEFSSFGTDNKSQGWGYIKNADNNLYVSNVNGVPYGYMQDNTDNITYVNDLDSTTVWLPGTFSAESISDGTWHVNISNRQWAFHWLKNVQKPSASFVAETVETPKLTDCDNSTLGHFTKKALRGCTIIPFYRCDDDQLSEKDRVQTTPYYKLYRYESWKCIYWEKNDTSLPSNVDKTKTFTYGFTKTKSETFTKKFGLSVSAGIAYEGLSFEATASEELGFQSTKTFSESFGTKTTYKIPCSADAHHTSSTWIKVYTYEIYRIIDGQPSLVDSYNVERCLQKAMEYVQTDIAINQEALT